jgi:hypothetical protein
MCLFWYMWVIKLLSSKCKFCHHFLRHYNATIFFQFCSLTWISCYHVAVHNCCVLVKWQKIWIMLYHFIGLWSGNESIWLQVSVQLKIAQLPRWGKSTYCRLWSINQSYYLRKPISSIAIAEETYILNSYLGRASSSEAAWLKLELGCSQVVWVLPQRVRYLPLVKPLQCLLSVVFFSTTFFFNFQLYAT